MVEHRIDVQGHEPVKQKVRRTSPRKITAAQEEVDRMLAEEIIEPSEGPWSSCLVIVPKSNGKNRFCIDYRLVNRLTKRDAYPIPYMDDIFDKLRSAKYISTLDLSQAYHQIPLEVFKSREVTAFTVPGRGLMQFTRMPYGLTKAPASFQQIMDKLIRPEWNPHEFAYLDDIVIVTESFQEHIKWLRIVLEALQKANLQVNKERSRFCVSEVKYLGYVVNADGLHADPDKVKPITEYPAPTNLHQLRRFLGMMGWYFRFIPKFADYRAPLNKLTRKGIRWHWEAEQEDEKTFDRLASYYYWPGFYYDTACYVLTALACQDCQLHKVSLRAPAGLMGERYVEGPWSVVAADIMGPLCLPVRGDVVT